MTRVTASLKRAPFNSRLVQTDVVETDEYHGGHIGVDVDHKLKPGTYVIKAINGSNSTNHKLIVQ